MESDQDSENLQWLLQVTNSDNNGLIHTLSFHLSQPASNCYQETENSLIIHIAKESLSRFSEYIEALDQSASASRTNQSPLRNLEFHTVEWDSNQVKNLCTLMENNPGISRLVFNRNKFSTESLIQFTEFLRKCKCVREIKLSESCIGSQGARLLAAALKENTNLEELRIHDDSIGFNGAEELSTMIEANTTLKLLNIFDTKPIIAMPIISAVLARNRSIDVDICCGKTRSNVVEFRPEKSTLKLHSLDISSLCHITCSLGLNSTVIKLDMSGLKLNSRWAKEFRIVLEQNRTLKEVVLSEACLKDKAVVYVSAGLFRNKSLEKLYLHGNRFGAIGVEHLLCPLSRFSSLQLQANTTLKSVTLGGKKTKIGRDGLMAVLQMLKSNQSVTYLGIYEDENLKPDDMIKIFKSLERNQSLRCLSLQGCKGVRGDKVLETITETLSINPWIEEIDLTRTPLQLSDKTEGIYQMLLEREKSESEEIDYLKDMPLIVPRTCRVFLCGQDFAGKSTLCNSITQNFLPSKVPCIDQVRNLVNPIEQAVKRSPSGIRIKTFTDEETKISLWNFGTQHEFMPLHDLMFPGPGCATFFIIVSSLFKKPSNKEPKNPDEIEEDLQYWLRLIVSNSRRAVQQCMLPSVTIVLSHYDKMVNKQQSDSSFQTTSSLIQKLKDKFQGSVQFHPIVFTVDARSSASVNRLSHHIRITSKNILERVPRIYQICNNLAGMLSEWRHENRCKPVMRWKDFEELCQVKIPYLRIRSRRDEKEKVEMRRKGMAVNLHSLGELIYFQDSGLLFLDFEWFFGEVISQLTRLDVKRQSLAEKNGFLHSKDLEEILRESCVLEEFEASDIVSMMLKLELCFEQDPSNSNSLLFVPYMLEDGRWKPQKWSVQTHDSNYVGRRLRCDDSSHMFFTPCLFPKMQVHLHKKIMELKNQHGASIDLEKYMISITMNGIHVRVEHGGQSGDFIDVLACSTKTQTEMLRLLQHLVVPSIQNVCNNNGFVLTEHVIRSECVRNLTPPRFRKSQCVPLQQLKQALLSVPADGIYDYQHTWDSVADSASTVINPGFDFARDLLSDNDFREVLQRRYNDLYNLAVELQIPDEEEEEEETSDSIDPSLKGIAKGVETILQKLNIIEREIRDVKHEIQGLRHYEHRLLIELNHKVNFLVNYNAQLEERKVPNMFYFVATQNHARRLITSIISGMSALTLHMLCEFRQEMHVVEEQTGIELMQVDNIAVRCLAPYTKKFMTILTFALKVGAHLAAGMGSMIPDLGREVAHLTESPFLYGAAAAGLLAVGTSRERSGSRDIGQDLRTAQQWLFDFLRDQRCLSGKEIAEKFGLWRVRYRDDGKIAWICGMHMHARGHEIVQVPV